MTIRRWTALVAAIAFLCATVLPWPAPVEARIVRTVLVVTVTSSAVTAFTADTRLSSRKVSFQADSSNSATIYVGDTTLNPASATTLRDTAWATLPASNGFTPTPSAWAGNNGEAWRLSDFRASGTTGDKVRMTYERVLP